MSQMETITALLGISFALLLAALAVAPNLIGVYRELRAQKRQGGQRNLSGLLGSYPPPVPFNFPSMSLEELSTETRGQRNRKGHPAQLGASKLLEAYPAPVPFNYPQMLSGPAQDKK